MIIGDKVAMTAFTDCFGQRVPETPPLTITGIRHMVCDSIPCYDRITATAANGDTYEGAERFFVLV